MALDYSFSYNGLSFGNGTTVQILQVDGLESLPPMRNGDIDRAYFDGQIAGLDLASGRDIQFSLQAFDSGAGDYFATVERIKTAFAPGYSTEQQLVFQLPGRAQRAINCRPRRRDITVDPQYSFRAGIIAVELHATDPRIYDATWTAANLSVPTNTTGLVSPLVSPFVFGTAGSAGGASVLNQGNAPAPWVCQIYGPCTNPVLVAPSGSLTFIGTLFAGDILTIDSQARTVILNGSGSRYSWLVPGSIWFTLPAQTAITVQMNASSTTGTAVFSYRSAWL